MKPLFGVAKASGTQTNIDKIVPNLLEKRKEGPIIIEFAHRKIQKVEGRNFGEITSNVTSAETVGMFGLLDWYGNAREGKYGLIKLITKYVQIKLIKLFLN